LLGVRNTWSGGGSVVIGALAVATCCLLQGLSSFPPSTQRTWAVAFLPAITASCVLAWFRIASLCAGRGHSLAGKSDPLWLRILVSVAILSRFASDTNSGAPSLFTLCLATCAYSVATRFNYFLLPFITYVSISCVDYKMYVGTTFPVVILAPTIDCVIRIATLMGAYAVLWRLKVEWRGALGGDGLVWATNGVIELWLLTPSLSRVIDPSDGLAHTMASCLGVGSLVAIGLAVRFLNRVVPSGIVTRRSPVHRVPGTLGFASDAPNACG